LNRFKILLAQKNSVAKIPNPKGMTTTAGPGSTIMATPTSRTVNPITATAILRACLIENSGFMIFRKSFRRKAGRISPFSRCSFLLG
jgi:hypothetical protein